MTPAIDVTPTTRRAVPPRSSERFARPRLLELPRPRGELVHTHDGRQLHLRHIEPGDVAALKRQFSRLSPEDIRRLVGLPTAPGSRSA